MKTLQWPLLLSVAAVGGVLLYVAAKKKPGQSMGAAIGAAAAGAVVDVATGAAVAVTDAAAAAVVGVGQLVGIPETNSDQCGEDLANGRLWDASFSCPASRFVGGAYDATFKPAPVFASTTLNDAARRDAWLVDQAIAQSQEQTGGATGYW